MPPNSATKGITAQKHPKVPWETVLAFQDIIVPPERPIPSPILLVPIQKKGQLFLRCVFLERIHLLRGRHSALPARRDMPVPSMEHMLPNYVRREHIEAKQMQSRVTYAPQGRFLQKKEAVISPIACLVHPAGYVQRKV